MEAFIFPGQGSQRRGMGQGLFDSVPEFLTLEGEIDSVLGYSVRSLCLEDKQNRLRSTEYTQPCLYVVNALHYLRARAEKSRPTFVAGHSLGEYNALLAAGAFDLMTGLRIVKKRGELMSRAKNGGMAAVVGMSTERLKSVLQESGLSALDVANYNSPMQTVVSGATSDISKAGPILEKAGAQLYVPLPVSAAFHSRCMADAGQAFGDFIRNFSFSSLSIPVISNVSGEPYPSADPQSTIPSLLTKQITNSVMWVQSVRYMLQRGVDTFSELGPGDVLTKLVNQIRQHQQSSAASGSGRT